MSALNTVMRLLKIPEDAELLVAQAHALTRQIPLMYAMLLTNSLILAGSYYGAAPVALTLYVPGLLTCLGLIRLVMWWRGRHRALTAEQARRMLKSMVWLTAAMSFGFTSWALALFPHGNAYQQSHIAFYMGITTIGCMFCLMHVPAASLTVAALVLIPFTVFFVSADVVDFTALAVNMVLVVAALIVILLGNYRDFAELVASRSATAQKQAETQSLSDDNDRLANMDMLTGLPNRRLFARQLETAMADGRAIAVARIDLDAFKSVNETFGQITGDRVLLEVARRITANSPAGAFVARLAADNFALILTQAYQSTDLQALGDRLCATLRRPFDLPGARIRLSGSIGFAISRTGDTADAVYDRADYVTSMAKQGGRGTAVVFAERHENELSKVRQIEHELRTADLDAEISIVFQQQFDIARNCITGYEVLARWNSPVLGTVSPVEFVPLAERTGLIIKVTNTVLRKALAASAKLPSHIRLSVNLSAHDVGSTTAIETIADLVARNGTPSRIDFEITETAVMRDIVQAKESLKALLALGSRIALDDFGTGHSSLTHVQKLPLNRIKIDRSFVADICNDRTSQAIVKTTVDLCNNLGISCVLEGVETEAQLRSLVSLGGSVMQGYLFGRPVSEQNMHEELMQEWQSLDSQPARAISATS